MLDPRVAQRSAWKCRPAIGSVLLPLLLLLALLPALLAADDPPQAADGSPDLAADEAAAEAWPMFRGSLAGTGRSAAHVTLPLVERWHRQIDKTAFEATPVIAGGRIFLGDLDGTFHCLDLADGRTLWSKKSEAGFPSAAAVSAAPGRTTVVVGDGAGLVRAFDAADGTELWTHQTGGEISGGPTLIDAPDGPRVLIGSQDATLSCLAVGDGAIHWTHSIADQIRCSPTVAAGKVLLAGCDGKLHVIDAHSGVEDLAVPIDGPTGTTPAAAGGRVLFGSEGGVFWAIDVVAGKPAWKLAPSGSSQAYRSSAAIAGGLALVGTRGRAVEAFAIADGTRAWRQAMRGRVDGSPVIVHDAATPGDLLAIVGDSAGKIVALRSSDGEKLWEFDAGSGFASSPAVAAGSVVMAADDGTVWCFVATP
ncbi:MAG: serine/threonine protein kinase [Planctomycetota bacterium]|nr:MAG: serine/threonine protein kinase [Planctomycetota bacterium]